MEKGIALLSGGIDSPVSIHKVSDRMEIIAVHFHQQAITDGTEIEKVKQLAIILKLKKVLLVPFTPTFTALASKCNHKDYYILGKIAMLTCAQLIAKDENAKFLITGENLGQVSSQTLSNLTTITSFIDTPILRPVLAYDKQETINIAKLIGTYETSKGPELCCLLGPKDPSTKSTKANLEKELSKINLLNLCQDAIKNMEIVNLN